MYLTIYLDVYFLINVWMDFILLFLVNRIGTVTSTYVRLALAAISGGIISCLGILPIQLPVLLKLLFFFALAGAGMILIGFPYKGIKKFITQLFELYLVAFLFSGLCNFVQYYGQSCDFIPNMVYKNLSVWELAAGAGAGVILFPLGWFMVRWMKREKELFLKVQIGYGTNKVNGIGLADSGNLLQDPLTKRPVLVAEYGFMKELFSEKQQHALDLFIKQGFAEEDVLCEKLLKARMIPYHSIGKENGLIIAVIVDYIKTEGKCQDEVKKDVLVGLYPGRLSSKGKYQVILHKELI